jgi:hypothetical protein
VTTSLRVSHDLQSVHPSGVMLVQQKPDDTVVIVAKDIICSGVCKVGTHGLTPTPDGIVSTDTAT